MQMLRCTLLLLVLAGHANADYIYVNGNQYNGRLISLTSTEIGFDFDCSNDISSVTLVDSLEVVIGKNCTSDYIPVYIGGGDDLCGVLRGRSFEQIFLVQVFDEDPGDNVFFDYFVTSIDFDGENFQSMLALDTSTGETFAVEQPEIQSITVLGPDWCS